MIIYKPKDLNIFQIDEYFNYNVNVLFSKLVINMEDEKTGKKIDFFERSSYKSSPFIR